MIDLTTSDVDERVHQCFQRLADALGVSSDEAAVRMLLRAAGQPMSKEEADVIDAAREEMRRINPTPRPWTREEAEEFDAAVEEIFGQHQGPALKLMTS